MKGKDLHLRLLYLAKLSFRIERQMKCFPDKVKFKEFIIIKLPKIKNKERTLKATRGESYLQRSSHKTIS